MLDLDYSEDSTAETDANFVLTGAGGLVEIQGTAEGAPFTEDQLAQLLRLARKGIGELVELQKQVLTVRLPRGSHPGRRQPQSPARCARSRRCSARTASSRSARAIWICRSRKRPAPPSPPMPNSRRAPPPMPASHPALADDSGLWVDALDGDPGIYSARWAGPAKDFRIAMARVERELLEKQAHDLSAKFVCALVAGDAAHGEKAETFEGEVHGHLTFPPRGNRGFGYDPDLHSPTAGADLRRNRPARRKHAMSHRATALSRSSCTAASCARKSF